MTRAEMSEIFAVLMVAYPKDELFRAKNAAELEAKLDRAITLWAVCLGDLDRRTVELAIVRHVNGCKFFPSVSEIREAAEQVRRDEKAEISHAWRVLTMALDRAGSGTSPERVIALMPSRIRRTVAEMGGPEPDGTISRAKFEATYARLLRGVPSGLSGGQKKRLN